MRSDAIRVLAVDDVPQNLIALEAALDQPGVELVTAPSGEAALELMLQNDFALALLDVQMPGMDGFELAELMRGTERTRAVPIIFLTAVATDETRRFRGFEAGAVDYMLKPLDMHALNGKVAVFVELARQRAALAQQRDELGLALSRLRAHGDSSPLATIELDPQLRIVFWAKGAERLFGLPAEKMQGTLLKDAPFLLPDQRDAFLAELHPLFGEESSVIHGQAFLAGDGTVRHGEWYGSSVAGAQGRTHSVMLQMLDVTDRHQAEETQRLLIGELNHRVKNSLATVQAIATQSFRHSRDAEDFRSAFTGRIQALSGAHSLLSATTWEKAGLRKLIGDQLAIGSVDEGRLHMAGPDVSLAPEMALRFAMVLHELVTNAQKYGALSRGGGTVRLSWRVVGAKVCLQWVESGGPPVVAPGRRGFGSTLISQSMAFNGCESRVEFDPDGVRWQLELNHDGVAAAIDGAANDATATDVAANDVAPNDGGEAPPLVATADADSALTGALSVVDPAERLPCSMRVLVVEDEPLVALDIMAELEDAGHEAIGPIGRVDQALSAIHAERPDFALLDGNLNGEAIDAVADLLAASGVPFAFVSGYGRDHLPRAHSHRPMIGKPFAGSEILAVLNP